MELGPTVLASLVSPRRREILRLVWNEERSAGDIHRSMPDVTFGAVSLHLRLLTETGLLGVRGDRQYRFYSARKEALGPLGQMLENMWDDACTGSSSPQSWRRAAAGRGRAAVRRNPRKVEETECPN